MSENTMLDRLLARFPWGATLAYLALVIAFVAATWSAVADILDRRAEVAAARDILEQVQGRKPSARGLADSAGGMPAGSPFLEGPTVTVAGAALLQRVAGAVAKVGGNVLSSQVELQGTRSKAGFIGVLASCEVEQPALQQLLYDIEAGMPFLFVDQLVVQAPVASATSKEGRMRILLAVSGQWRGEK
jgi:general secretion pathway protein M